MPQLKFLSDDDMVTLQRIVCNFSDNEGYSEKKAAMQRLAELGVVMSQGFGRYGVTSFGYWIVETLFDQKPTLPLRTIAEHNARTKAGCDLYLKGRPTVPFGDLPASDQEQWKVAAENHAARSKQS